MRSVSAVDRQPTTKHRRCRGPNLEPDCETLTSAAKAQEGAFPDERAVEAVE